MFISLRWLMKIQVVNVCATLENVLFFAFLSSSKYNYEHTQYLYYVSHIYICIYTYRIDRHIYITNGWVVNINRRSNTLRGYSSLVHWFQRYGCLAKAEMPPPYKPSAGRIDPKTIRHVGHDLLTLTKFERTAQPLNGNIHNTLFTFLPTIPTYLIFRHNLINIKKKKTKNPLFVMRFLMKNWWLACLSSNWTTTTII